MGIVARLNASLHMYSNNPINRFMMKYPLYTSLGLNCVKTIAADLMVQVGYEGKSRKEIDWSRTSVFAAFGLVYLGGFQYWLYNIVYFVWFPNVTVMSTIKKVAFDQFVKHPFIYWPTYYTLQTALNEKQINLNTFSTVFTTWRGNVFEDMRALWSIWMPAQMITFGVMPMHLRLPFVAGVSFIWTCCLSLMRGSYDAEAPELGELGETAELTELAELAEHTHHGPMSVVNVNNVEMLANAS